MKATGFKKVYLGLAIILTASSMQAETWYVGRFSPAAEVSSITEAIERAEAGDTILVEWEGPIMYFQYDEALVIPEDKAGLKIISRHWDEEDYRWPTIRFSFKKAFPSHRECIIRVDAPDVSIKGFHIIGDVDSVIDGARDIGNMEDRIGILVKNGGFTLENCYISQCRVGVKVDYRKTPSKGFAIKNCRIGCRNINPWPIKMVVERYLGNFYGIVVVSGESQSGYASQGNVIENSELMRNRFFGLIVDDVTHMDISGSKIVFNGTGTVGETTDRIDGGIWIKKGGDADRTQSWITRVRSENDIQGNQREDVVY